MPNVKNNHKAALNVAGVDIRPGATAAVDDGRFDKWKNGNAAKIWLDQKLITTDSKAVKDDGGDDRAKLASRASALGVNFSGDTSDEDLSKAVKDLSKAVKEAEKAAGEGEREQLLAEARELGLNPNANTGVEKLRKMIADKKQS